jgi:hypothetical protein
MVVNATLLGFHRKGGKRGVFIVSSYGLGVSSAYFNYFYFGFILVLFGEPLIVSPDRQDTPL